MIIKSIFSPSAAAANCISPPHVASNSDKASLSKKISTTSMHLSSASSTANCRSNDELLRLSSATANAEHSTASTSSPEKRRNIGGGGEQEANEKRSRIDAKGDIFVLAHIVLIFEINTVGQTFSPTSQFNSGNHNPAATTSNHFESFQGINPNMNPQTTPVHHNSNAMQGLSKTFGNGLNSVHLIDEYHITL